MGYKKPLTKRRTEWIEQNAAALQSYNDYVERNGVPLERFRLFGSNAEKHLPDQKAAKVKATPVKAGESVAVDQVIMEFE